MARLPAEQALAKGKSMDDAAEQVSFGYEQVSREEKTRRVGDVFRSVAARYDLLNDLMSGGLHRLCKDQFVRRVQPRPGEAILDMAGVPGHIAFRMAARGAQVTVTDIPPAMPEAGVNRAAEPRAGGLAREREKDKEA